MASMPEVPGHGGSLGGFSCRYHRRETASEGEDGKSQVVPVRLHIECVGETLQATLGSLGSGIPQLEVEPGKYHDVTSPPGWCVLT